MTTKPTPITSKPSVEMDTAYDALILNLTSCAASVAQIADEDSAAYQAAMNALHDAQKALAAFVDCYAARQVRAMLNNAAGRQDFGN